MNLIDEGAVYERALVVAKEFHEAYERLAPQYGYATREQSAVPWEHVPEANKAVMCATVRDLINRGIIS